MANKLKITTKDYISEVYSLCGNEYEVLGEYLGVNKKINMKHTTCGHIWDIAAGNFTKKGQRCPNCSKSSRRKTTERFKQEVYELHGNEYTVIGEYITKKEKIEMKHNVCGNTYKSTPDSIVNLKRGCPYCYGNLKLTNEDIQNRLNKKYILVGDYVNLKTKIYVKDKHCGHIFETFPQTILDDKIINCPICGQFRKNLNTNDFSKEIYNEVGNEYTLISEYIHTHQPVVIKHNVCNNEYMVSRTNFLGSPNRKGRRCPYCSSSNGKSIEEKEIINYIKTFYNGNIIENDKSLLSNRKELDIYFPELKLAIEYNGIYWHTEGNSKNRCNSNYHLKKTKECEDLGIKLIHIFDDEWINKKDIVKSKIKHIMGYNSNEKIYARKCIIKEIENSKIKNDFLNKNHIQGEDKSILNLGLYYEDKLISIMTFSELRKSLGQDSKKNIYELSRFATNINYQVPGAFGKLWSYFINKYEFSSIITYADRRWSVGNMYNVNGFILDHISKPNYWYVNSNASKRYHRYSFRKQVLDKKFPEIYNVNKTEKEIMLEAGYDILWDCGNLVYIYNN